MGNDACVCKDTCPGSDSLEWKLRELEGLVRIRGIISGGSYGVYLSADPETLNGEVTRDDPGDETDDIGPLARWFSKAIKKWGSFQRWFSYKMNLQYRSHSQMMMRPLGQCLTEDFFYANIQGNHCRAKD